MITKIDHKCHHFEEKRDVLTSDTNRHVLCVCMYVYVCKCNTTWLGYMPQLIRAWDDDCVDVYSMMSHNHIFDILLLNNMWFFPALHIHTHTYTTLLLFRAAFKVCLTFMDFRLFLSPIWMVIKWTLLCLRLLHD